MQAKGAGAPGRAGPWGVGVAQTAGEDSGHAVRRGFARKLLQ
jgi:hypothetical protein